MKILEIVEFIKNLHLKLFKNKIVVKVKYINGNPYVPVYSTEGSVCADVRATQDYTIKPKQVIKIPLGIAVEIPKGYEIQVRNRSSLGKNGLIVPNGIGTIDTDYRGEINMLFYNLNDTDYEIKAGDKICQLAIQKATTMIFKTVSELSETERGEGGFGSTGR